MGLTRCYKTAVFTFIFAVIQSQSLTEILLPLLENGRNIEILLPVSIFSFSSSSACEQAPTYQLLSELNDQRQSYDIM